MHFGDMGTPAVGTATAILNIAFLIFIQLKKSVNQKYCQDRFQNHDD